MTSSRPKRRPRTPAFAAFEVALAVALLVAACGPKGTTTNGTGSGGNAAGTGGMSSSSGGAGVGGAGTGGAGTGGAATGGAATGGAATGGARTGTGGASTGGAGTGGANTGGTTATGGSVAATGGRGGAGGAGGAATGGAGVGGRVDVTGVPFTVKAGLFDQTKTDDLGLSPPTGVETITIFRPTDTGDHFGNGVVLTTFKGWLYAQWQSSASDEDSADTWTAYSRSQDGKTWSAPMVLAASSSQGPRTSGGWWASGDTLVAYINVWPATLTPRGGTTQVLTSTDGVTWSAPKALPMSDGSAMNGVFEQDPHALPDGRIIGAAHFQPGLTVAPIYTDDSSGLAGWKRAPFPSLSRTTDSTREMEPSWYRRTDGAVVMVFRDQNSTFHKLASASGDRGATWTTPVETDMPDSRSKQSAGNLPSGAAYFAGNPVPNKTRVPLVVTLSRDGRLFDKAFVLRKGGADLQAQRYPGTSKTLGYSYPKSMVAGGYLYVGYSTNKEDVQLTRVPVTSLDY